MIAVEKLWKLIQLVREGPRNVTISAPSDQQIVDAPDQDQERRMLEMLQGVSSRVSADLNENQE